MTTTQHSAPVTPPATTAVDRLLLAVAGGRGGEVGPAYAPQARLDATVPNWRFTRVGSAAVAEQYREWFRHPGRFEELERAPVPGGEVVRYLLVWQEGGVPHAGHHCHWLTVDAGSGLIVHDRFFCGGRWGAGLLAEMAEAERGR